MTSQRKRRIRTNRLTAILLERRLTSSLEERLWEQMPAVGHEFGSPDFDRLMEEDFRHSRGVFDPELVSAANVRRMGFLRGKIVVPADFDARLPDDVLADFEGGAEA